MSEFKDSVEWCGDESGDVLLHPLTGVPIDRHSLLDLICVLDDLLDREEELLDRGRDTVEMQTRVRDGIKAVNEAFQKLVNETVTEGDEHGF